MYQPSGIDIHLHIPTPSFTVITYTIVTMKNCMALAIALTVATLLFLNLSSGGGAYYYNRLTDEFKEVILDKGQREVFVGMLVHIPMTTLKSSITKHIVCLQTNLKGTTLLSDSEMAQKSRDSHHFCYRNGAAGQFFFFLKKGRDIGHFGYINFRLRFNDPH
jgi:hypothetical protein